MKIVEQQFHRGPNIWSQRTGLRAGCSQVPMRPGSDIAPAELEAFLAELARAIPIVPESAYLASADYMLGSEIAAIGIVLAICEIVTRDYCAEPAIGEMLGSGDGTATLFVPCDDPPIAVASLHLALEIANAIPSFRIAEPARFRAHFLARYRNFRSQMRLHRLDQSTLALVRGAAARGIPFTRMTQSDRFVQLGQGIHGRRVKETASDALSSVGTMISIDKLATNLILERSGIPTPSTHPVHSAPDALKVAEKLGFPLVIKPCAAGKGIGVKLNLRNPNELRQAIETSGPHRKGLVVERFITGEDYRLLVVAGRLVAAARREPAHVTGDGVSSVRELVERANMDPRRGMMPFERLLERIELDAEALEHLAKAGLGIDSVPEAGIAVPLHGAANISQGGTAVDVTDIVHPDNRMIAERAARLIGVNVAGIDFISPDIARSWREVPSAILEVNTMAGLRAHLVSNPDREIVAPIIDQLFPPGSDGCVPTVGITGSLGKTSTTMMVAAILSKAGLRVACATTQGAWIGDDPIRSGDLAFGGVARQLLLDPLAEAGAFELARGALVKSGLGLDRLDVGMVLGVLDDHLGLDGAETREDLARIKRLVVENARKLAVLNADDPLCLAMRRHAGTRRIGLVGASEGNAKLLKHRDAGGLAAWIGGDDNLVLFDEKTLVGRIALGDLPDTWNGSFRPAALNALFAACACHGLGIDFAIIGEALTSFRSTIETNPGRNNYFENLPFRLLVSHADSPEAIRELAKLVRDIEVGGAKRLLLTGVGNRPDAFVWALAKEAAGGFSEYVCTDWDDLRGRAPGEVTAMLAASLCDAGVDPASIRSVATADEAIRAAYSGLEPGDLLVDAFGGHFGDQGWLARRSLKISGNELVQA